MSSVWLTNFLMNIDISEQEFSNLFLIYVCILTVVTTVWFKGHEKGAYKFYLNKARLRMRFFAISVVPEFATKIARVN